MGKVYEIKQDNFSGGLSEDKRVKDLTKFSITKHLDTFTYPHKLVPHFKTVECSGTYKTKEIRKFLYAPWLAAGAARLYGLGVVAGTTKAKVFTLNVADLTNSWETPNNGESGNTGRNTDVFFYYKDYIYMWRTSYLMRFKITADEFSDTYQNITWTDVAQPVHHPSDDIAYFFHDNVVAKLDNVTFTDNVLTLPSNLKIVSVCAYGNYLAIGCVSKTITADIKSIVYLWDRDSSLATLTDRIDFGEGKLVHLANLNNKLIGVINFYANSAFSLDKPRVLIKQASGQFAVLLNEIILDDVTSESQLLPATSFMRNNILYFPMWADLNGDLRHGIWALDSNGRIALEIIEEDLGDTEGFLGIFRVGNVWFLSYGNDYTISHSSGSYSTTNSSVLETLIINGGDSAITKKLSSVCVMTDPLPAAGQIVLKYRKDEDIKAGSWTTISTHTTDDSISHSSVNIEATGVNLPAFKEIQFQVLSTGGAEITGWKAKVEIIDKDIF